MNKKQTPKKVKFETPKKQIQPSQDLNILI